MSIDVDEIVRALRLANAPMTAPTLAIQLGQTEAGVRKRLAQLRREGRVEPADVRITTQVDRQMTVRGYQLTKKKRRK